MEVIYASHRLERNCTSSSRMQREYGAQVAKVLRRRITELIAVETFDDLLRGTGKWEQLTGERVGQWSARLTANWRLIVSGRSDQAVIACVEEVIDYH